MVATVALLRPHYLTEAAYRRVGLGSQVQRALDEVGPGGGSL